MFVRLLLGAIGLYELVAGVIMLIDPERWYASVPGVTATGPMNHHFVIDIGLAFAASGVGMLMGLRKSPTAAAFALAGAAWPALHGLVHLWGWLSEGVPSTIDIVATDLGAVMLPSFLGLALALIAMRRATLKSPGGSLLGIRA